MKFETHTTEIMSRISEETAKGVKWTFLQKISLQPVQFVFGIILARLISPAEMGILGLTGIFFAYAGQLQDGGFGAALIRKQNRTKEDINTIFWFNIGMSFILSASLFASASCFAVFFGQPALTNLTRVSAVMLFLQSTTNVHWTLYKARRDFKTPAIIGIVATLIPMPFTVWAAYEGWSYWAPMLQGVLSGLLRLIIVWCISPWKPSFEFSPASFREFFGFSAKLTLSGLVSTTYFNLRTFLIGKFYSPAELALFTRGYTTTSFSLNIVQGIVGDVTYPVLSTIQHDQERLLNVYRQYIRLTSLIVSWGMVTLATNSRSFINVLYGDKWLPCAVYASLLCLGIMLDPLSNINSNLYSILGRTDMTLRKEVILRTFGISAMLLGAWHSVMGVCVAAVLTGWVAFLLSIYLTSRICRLRVREQLADYFPYVLMAAAANIPSLLIAQLNWAPILTLISGVFASAVIYALFLFIRKDNAWGLLLAFIKKKIPIRQFSKR